MVPELSQAEESCERMPDCASAFQHSSPLGKEVPDEYGSARVRIENRKMKNRL